jgi:hypothetical protein
MHMPAANALLIPTLGPCCLPSPLQDTGARFVDDTHRILVSAATSDLQPLLASGQVPPAFELAGPAPGSIATLPS